MIFQILMDIFGWKFKEVIVWQWTYHNVAISWAFPTPLAQTANACPNITGKPMPTIRMASAACAYQTLWTPISRVIPAAESFEDPICVEGFTLVNGVCEQDASDSGMVPAEETDPPDSDSSMPICPVNYFYDDTYEWSDETGDRIGACVPDPTFLVCNQGFHYQPSGEKGTDSLLAGGTCVEDYSPPVQADEVSPEDLIEESVIVEEVQAALEAAGPVFTPVVGCCTTEIGNAIVTGLLENYRSELETIY